MQAIILAAGMGKRLKKLTANNTKCMVKVNGISLIERMLHQLDGYGLSRIVIVIGYEGKKLVDYISTLYVQTELVFVDNPIYDRTNNIYSLSLAKDYLLQEDTLLLESDLIFEDSVLDLIVKDQRDTLALVDHYESWMDGTCVKLREDDSIEAFIPGKSFKFDEIKEYYKTVNIYKFSKLFSKTHYVPFLEAYSKALGNNEYYEQVLRVITMLDDPGIWAKRLSGQLWYEIDDVQDLDIASSMFVEDDEKRLTRIQQRYGGYWRYPHMLDFCYLVNPFFPPQRMIDEIKVNFETLLTQYPSGLQINALLAAKDFNVDQDYIVVGNGAAELIKSIMNCTDGKLGIIRPTFEEYPNRYSLKEILEFIPENDEFAYSAQDLIDYYSSNTINTLILINPDNPSGNYLPFHDVCKLAEWAERNSVRLILDESFADFSDEEQNSFLNDRLLEEFPSLVVVKSISKSYGVPGLRLGITASSNRELICKLKKDVSIWNINSFAEFYLQIEEKYKKEYQEALRLFRAERNSFVTELSKIQYLKVLPTQANYVMVRLLNGMEASSLTVQMLKRFGILIKDLSGKIDRGRGEYVRIAIRNHQDNMKLICALKLLLGENNEDNNI